jgi:hypothetical protein
MGTSRKSCTGYRKVTGVQIFPRNSYLPYGE